MRRVPVTRVALDRDVISGDPLLEPEGASASSRGRAAPAVRDLGRRCYRVVSPAGLQGGRARDGEIRKRQIGQERRVWPPQPEADCVRIEDPDSANQTLLAEAE